MAPAGGHVYAAAGPGMISPDARGVPPRLYVAHGRAVEIVDAASLRTVGRLRTGAAQVAASWDMRRLWATDPAGGALVPFGPGGARGRAVRAGAPAGLYFTPEGRSALVLAHRPHRVEVRDRRTMRRGGSVPLPCAARYADFTSDGASLVATCTSAGALARVDVAGRRLSGTLRLPEGASPGDLRLSPDGSLFYVADSAKGGVWMVDAARLSVLGFVRTGPGARGLSVGRNARRLFVVGAGSLTAVEFATRRVSARWPLPAAVPPCRAACRRTGRPCGSPIPAASSTRSPPGRAGSCGSSASPGAPAVCPSIPSPAATPWAAPACTADAPPARPQWAGTWCQSGRSSSTRASVSGWSRSR